MGKKGTGELTGFFSLICFPIKGDFGRNVAALIRDVNFINVRLFIGYCSLFYSWSKTNTLRYHRQELDTKGTLQLIISKSTPHPPNKKPRYIGEFYSWADLIPLT